MLIMLTDKMFIFTSNTSISKFSLITDHSANIYSNKAILPKYINFSQMGFPMYSDMLVCPLWDIMAVNIGV